MYSDKPTTPEGLHELEYARHLLEEVLGWPAKGNIELVADCIRAISPRQIRNAYTATAPSPIYNILDQDKGSAT